MATGTQEKTKEKRLRRMAERQGMVLRKSRRRDERALDFGAYWLIERNVVVTPSRGLDLDGIEAWLTEGGK